MLRSFERLQGDLVNTSTITVKAEIENIAQVTEFMEALLEELECPMKVLYQIDVAIDELLANVCSYAYANGWKGDGMVTVSFEAIDEGDAIRLTFEDTGVPFNPLLRPAPDTTLSIENRGIGGYGIFIVRTTMDDVTYERRGDRNILSIVKRLH